MAGEVYSFDKTAAQNVIKAAKQVLGIGDMGSTDIGSGIGGLQLITAFLLEKQGINPTYTWQQERRTETGWETVSNGLDDKDGANLAYDLDESSTSDLSNTHVFLARTVKRDDDDNIVPAWIIVWGAEDLRGTLQGQVRTMLSDRVGGWDYLRLHSV